MDEELWRKFLSCMEEQVGAAKFSTWFEPLKCLGIGGKCLRIQVSNDFRYMAQRALSAADEADRTSGYRRWP